MHAGQEYVWQKVWARFDISPSDLELFLAGPSFLSWQRMGNLQGYGGPLPQSYIDGQAGEHIKYHTPQPCCSCVILDVTHLCKSVIDER